MLNGHGNSHYNIKVPIQADFSSNIWYKGLDKGLEYHLQQTIQEIINYPVADASNLQGVVANYYGVAEGMVCVTNGATEAFYLVAHAFQSSHSIVLIPSFSEYNDAALLYKHKVSYLDNDEYKRISEIEASLVWIGNPNNPDGKVLSRSTIKELLESNPKKTFIIDEAYAEVCTQFDSSISLIQEFDNLVVIKSMTKQCIIPGLRLGYFIASEALRNQIAAYRMPWSVNSIALEAGRYIFKHLNDFVINTQELQKESLSFQKLINNIDGVEVMSSETNYFLCRLTRHKAKDLQDFLISKKGILIRDASNFKGLNDSYFRLAIQGENNNLDCANAIKEFVSK